VTEAVGAPAKRRGVLGPALLTLAALAVLIGLGTWQLERKAWKEGLIAALDARLSASPVALPSPAQWASLDPARDEFTRVTFRAEFLPDSDAIVWANASSMRDDVKPPGFYVFTPARLAGGELVVVNRGFVKDDHPGGDRPRPPAAKGAVEITGLLRWPEPPGWFNPATYSASSKLWFLRDHVAMNAERKWGAVAPFYVEREAQTPPDGLPSPGALKPNLPNNHRQYALTWYGLAIVLAVVFGFWMRGRRA
jgi:cytochrome oxidase assembly protein ShyY1